MDWIRTYRDLGGFYARMIREMGLDPLDAIAFSAGSYAAAEMAAADPGMFKHLVLVAPMGVKPEEGEITDIFPLTIRTHMRATVADINTPEFGDIYGGEMTPDQFEAFEDARAEAARIGWEPYMHNPSPALSAGGGKRLVRPCWYGGVPTPSSPKAVLMHIKRSLPALRSPPSKG